MRTRSPSWWASDFNPRTPRGVRRLKSYLSLALDGEFQSTHPARGATYVGALQGIAGQFQSTHPARGATSEALQKCWSVVISIHAPREGCDGRQDRIKTSRNYFNPRTPRGVRLRSGFFGLNTEQFQSTHPARGATVRPDISIFTRRLYNFNPRTPRGVRQQTLPKSREFAWLNLLICTRGRRLSIRKQTRLCSMKLSFMLFGCEPAGEGVSSWTSHATKSKVRLEGRSAYSQSVRSSAHSDFPGNKSGGCPVRDP